MEQEWNGQAAPANNLDDSVLQNSKFVPKDKNMKEGGSKELTHKKIQNQVIENNT
ncbi:hypothetical protein JOC77_002888 [Peribacillus deserti]|uniref:Uncharacterized protein n=1 Tax=Peribacillus deserti TaxID=673318 RepID=A0ABS2QJX0_9BACI|nr:hypothetical protein [Peribacillus deserti]MBM7693448.1 hypothetical protein [Peribacillus deserti]